MNKVGRGLTRIWIVFIGLIELGIGIGLVVSIYDLLQGDWLRPGHATIKAVSSPFIIGMSAVALVGYGLWYLAVWIVRGFSN